MNGNWNFRNIVGRFVNRNGNRGAGANNNAGVFGGPPRRRRRRRRRPVLYDDNFPKIPGDTREERVQLRYIRMQCIQRLRLDIYPDGTVQYLFHCRCCDSEFRSPHKWGGNRKTYHADTQTHQKNFLEFARLNNINYPPLNRQRPQLPPWQQQQLIDDPPPEPQIPENPDGNGDQGNNAVRVHQFEPDGGRGAENLPRPDADLNANGLNQENNVADADQPNDGGGGAAPDLPGEGIVDPPGPPLPDGMAEVLDDGHGQLVPEPMNIALPEDMPAPAVDDQLPPQQQLDPDPGPPLLHGMEEVLDNWPQAQEPMNIDLPNDLPLPAPGMDDQLAPQGPPPQ